MDSLVKLPSIFEEYFKDSKSTTLLLGSSVALIVTAYWIKNYIERRSFFERCHVPGPKPLPLFGNFLDIVRFGVAGSDMRLVNTYGKLCGYFEGSTPVIMTTDVKFIKSILIKDFGSFVNRRVIESFAIEPGDKFLTNLKDDEWKNVRSILTATFTSGKLKSVG